MLFIPYSAVEFLQARPCTHVDTSSLKALWVGGCTVTIKLMEDLKVVLPHTFVCQGYGQTEASGLITCFNLMKVDDLVLHKRNITSCGRIRPGLKWKVRILMIYFVVGLLVICFLI